MASSLGNQLTLFFTGVACAVVGVVVMMNYSSKTEKTSGETKRFPTHRDEGVGINAPRPSLCKNTPPDQVRPCARRRVDP